jgi:hypothetical protein
MSEHEFILPLHFFYHADQRRRFVAGELGPIWSARYPQLFDDDDCRLCRNQCKDGFHFYEWLAAILLYEATGYLSLVQKYGSKNHKRKLPIWEKVAPVKSLPDGYGYPDLFVYAPDRTDWYFCEVKGGRDRLQPRQLRTFRKLHKITGKPIRLMSLTEG